MRTSVRFILSSSGRVASAALPHTQTCETVRHAANHAETTYHSLRSKYLGTNRLALQMHLHDQPNAILLPNDVACHIGRRNRPAAPLQETECLTSALAIIATHQRCGQGTISIGINELELDIANFEIGGL